MTAAANSSRRPRTVREKTAAFFSPSSLPCICPEPVLVIRRVLVAKNSKRQPGFLTRLLRYGDQSQLEDQADDDGARAAARLDRSTLLRAALGKTAFLEPFDAKNDQFTKTGSGQT